MHILAWDTILPILKWPWVSNYNYHYYITLLVSSNCTFKESTSIGSSHLASKSDFSCKIWAFSALAESNSSWRLSSCFSTCSNLSGSAESLAYKQKYFINMKILKTYMDIISMKNWGDICFVVCVRDHLLFSCFKNTHHGKLTFKVFQLSFFLEKSRN